MLVKRKFLFLSVVFILVSSLSSIYAAEIGKEALSFTGQSNKWGLGIEGGIGAAAILSNDGLFAGFPDAAVSLTLHIPKTSFLLSAGVVGLGFRGYGINGNIDFLLGAFSPVNWFELHIFLGLGASIYGYQNGLGASLGVRLPLGMSFWLWNWFQIYLNITPILGVGLGVGDPVRAWIHVDGPIDLGVRFWF